MSREYKNIVLHDHLSMGEERRKAFAKEAMRDNTPFPKTLTYEDIDKEFKRWVEEDLDISFEGKRIPTMVLYSNQRFSEFKQSWEFNDEKHNLIMNFKTISRELNPKSGDLVGQTRNIPGERSYTINKELCQDENGRDYFKIYKMKQPYTIDLSYKIGIITNKFELINKFNMVVNEKFKSIDCYIRPNGHFIPMKLNDVSDDSELSLDDREFYSQSYNITVMAYIIDEDSYSVTEAPVLRLTGVDFEFDRTGNCEVDIEETDNGDISRFIVEFKNNGKDKVRFQNDTDLLLTGITIENIDDFKLLIDDEVIPTKILSDKTVINVIEEEVEESTKDCVPFKIVLEEKGEFMPIKLLEGCEIKLKNVRVSSHEKKGIINLNVENLPSE